MGLSLRAVHYFAAVAEAGSISAAARNLDTSQAAITEAIQGLESHLEILLFSRHARGMSLTHAGHEFLRHAQRIMAAVASAERALLARPDAMAGELIVGTTNPLTGYYLPGLMERYGRAFPNVRVRIYEDSGHFIEHKLINGELDAALMILSTLENSNSFKTAVLVSSPWRLWVSGRHRLIESDAASIKELQREPVIELRNDELELAAGNLWRRAGFMPQVVVRTRSVEATRNFVAAGGGVSLMPQLLFRPWSLDGEQLIALPLSEDLPPLEVGVAWRRGAPVSPETEAFLAVAREHASEATRRDS